MFALILGIVETKGLLNGRVLGVDSTYLRADASMKAIVRRDTKENYLEFVTRLATEAGVPNPTAEDARRLDRKRTGKKTSNREWGCLSRRPHCQAKDGRTRLAYKPEHVVDLETGAIVAAVVHPADVADPASVETSLSQAEADLQAAAVATRRRSRRIRLPRIRIKMTTACRRRLPAAKVVADKGYHKATLLRRLKTQRYRPDIPERSSRRLPPVDGQGGTPTAVAFHQNRARGMRPLGKRYHRWRAERVSGPSPMSARRVGRAGLACAGAGERRETLPAASRRGESRPRDADLVRVGHPARMGQRAQAAYLALFGSVCALLRWWRTHRRSLLAFSRPGGMVATERRSDGMPARVAGRGINQRAAQQTLPSRVVDGGRIGLYRSRFPGHDVSMVTPPRPMPRHAPRPASDTRAGRSATRCCNAG